MKMNRKTTALYATLGLVAALAGGTGLLAARAQQKTAAQPEPKCKISPVKAIEIAKGKVAGRALNANFEYDEGKWVYGVMIVSGNTIQEVEIDPMTGKVGDVEAVTPDGEAKEVQAELTKAIGGAAPAKAEAAGEKEEKDEKPEKP